MAEEHALKKYIRSELTGWKPFDITWLLLATAVILGLSIYWKDTLRSLTAAVTGTWCVILTGKGKRSSFIFGLVNTICYALGLLCQDIRKLFQVSYNHNILCAGKGKGTGCQINL